MSLFSTIFSNPSFSSSWLFIPKVSLLIAFIALSILQTAHAQCPPPGFPVPGDLCPQAPILCVDIDGYCDSLDANNINQTFPGCPSNALNNDEWLGFIAGSTTITMQVTMSNCEGTNGQFGMQAAIYQGSCGGPAVATQCECVTTNFTLSSSNFIIGQGYYLVLDGCAGDICDYSIDIISGSTLPGPPATPIGPIGPVSVCQSTTSNYEVGNPNAATFDWTLTPSSIGSIQGNPGNSITVNWTSTGTATLCVTASNPCEENPNDQCLTITVGPGFSISSNIAANTCGQNNGAIDLTVNPSGTYTYNWSNGATTQDLSNLPGGNYTVTVSATGGCSHTMTFNVPNTSVNLNLSGEVTHNTLCNGSNGSISLTINPPGAYNYIWSNGATTQNLSGLPGGSYFVTVSLGSCSTTGGFLVEDNTAPPPNDICSTAISLSLDGSIHTFDNICAELSSINPTCASGAVPDVWFSFEAPSSGFVHLYLNGLPNFGYVLYQNCNTSISCFHDNSSSQTLSVTLGNLTSGEIYQLLMWSDSLGEYDISLFNGCPPILVLIGQPILPRVYQAEEIVSTGSVAATTEVTFKAEDSIDLANGFEVALNAIFLATIEACSASMQNGNGSNNLTLPGSSGGNKLIPSSTQLLPLLPFIDFKSGF